MALTKDQVQERLLSGQQWFYFTSAESLRVTSLNSITGVTVTLTGRFLSVDSVAPSDVTMPHTPATDRTESSSQQVMGEGWLQSLTAIASSGTPAFGATFVRVDVVRGSGASATVLATLLQGFVSGGQRLAWPGSPIESSLRGPGRIRSITGTDGAAGAEILETVPAGARWRLISMRATLVADATVANRQPAIRIDDGTSDIFRAASGTSQTASTTWVYHWGEYGATSNVLSSANVISIPARLVLLAGWRIRTGTSNFQAGDDWSAPQLLVEEWLEGA